MIKLYTLKFSLSLKNDQKYLTTLNNILSKSNISKISLFKSSLFESNLLSKLNLFEFNLSKESDYNINKIINMIKY